MRPLFRQLATGRWMAGWTRSQSHARTAAAVPPIANHTHSSRLGLKTLGALRVHP